MFRLTLYLAGALFTATTFLAAQEVPAPKVEKSTAKPEAKSEAESEASAKTADDSEIDRLVAALGGDDFEARETAMESLRKMGKKARAKLEIAAKESENKEVRWNARQLLKQMKTTARPSARTRAEAPVSPERSATDERMGALRSRLDQLRSRHDALLKQMEALRRSFENGNLEGMLEDFGAEHGDWKGLLGGIEERLEGLKGLRGHIAPHGVAGEGLMFENSNGRIKVTVKRLEDGEEVEETFEAENAEEFKAKYPELAEKYGIRFGDDGTSMLFGGRSGGVAGETEPLPLGPDTITPVPVPAKPGERLGVMIKENVDAESAKKLGLEDGEGLEVIEVEAASLAEAAGVQAGDIVISVAGKSATGPEAVRDALKGVKAGEEFVVVVGRGGERVELKATKPVPAEKAKRAPKKLEKF